MGKEWKLCQTLFFGAPKSLQMLTVAKIKCCVKNEQICPSPSVRLIKVDDGLQYSHNNFLEAIVVWKCGMEIVARQFFRLLRRNVATFSS